MLKSYQTVVAVYFDGAFVKTWDGFSKTTQKHINIFRASFGLDPLSKREIIEMPTASGEYVNDNTGEVISLDEMIAAAA